MKLPAIITCVVMLIAISLASATADVQADKCVAKHAILTMDVTERIVHYVDQLEQANQSGSLLVGTRECIVAERAFGLADRDANKPITADTLFDIGSITKQFTAAAVLRLEVDGNLKTTDRLSRFFPDVPMDKRNITLHQLLTHSAGFPEAIGDDYDKLTREEFVTRALGTKLASVPGTEYQYSNVGYSLLAAIIETVAMTDYENYLKRHVFDLAELNNTGYRKIVAVEERAAVGYRGDVTWGKPVDKSWADDGPYWNLRGNGGILSTTRDLYQWHLALGGDIVLPEAAVAKLQTPYVREGADAPSYYAYGWAVFPTPRNTKRITHNGGNGIFFADLWRYNSEDIVIVVLTNESSKQTRAISQEVARTIFQEGYRPIVASDDGVTSYSLPDNPHGATVRSLIETLRDGRPSVLTILIEEAFTDQLRLVGTIDQHLGILGSIGDEIGMSEVAAVSRSSDRTEVTFANGIKLIVMFDGTESNLISGLGVED